jgi:hypothetical protein
MVVGILLPLSLGGCDGRDTKTLAGIAPDALEQMKSRVRERAGDLDATFPQLRRDPRTGFVCGKIYHGVLRKPERFVFAAEPILEFQAKPQAFSESWHSFCE